MIGTAEYAAPEQARGKAVFASDLYSLGVTCLHLLTQVSPFELFDVREGAWVWRQYLVNNPVSEKLADVLDRLIENATNKRYQSAVEVIKDLNFPLNQDEVFAVTFSPDGQTLISGSADKTIRIWRCD